MVNWSVLYQLLNGCLRSSAQSVCRFHLQEQPNEMHLFWCRISVPLLECERTFPPSSREWSLKLCYTSWCAQSLLTWLRELLEKTIWLHMKKKEIKVNYLLSLLSHSFKINFESDLQNLWYGKHTYFRFRLCRVGSCSQYVSTWESFAVSPVSNPRMYWLPLNLILLLGKKPTLLFLRQFHVVYGYVPIIAAAHDCILMRLCYWLLGDGKDRPAKYSFLNKLGFYNLSCKIYKS